MMIFIMIACGSRDKEDFGSNDQITEDEVAENLAEYEDEGINNLLGDSIGKLDDPPDEEDLFGRKTVVINNAESGSIDTESPKYILNRIEQEETFIPPVDFATASNFIRFGSAELYYDSALTRIYSEYPYDGSQAEQA